MKEYCVSDSEYKVSIKGAELSFEQTVSIDLAKRIVAMAASGGAASFAGGDKGGHGQQAQSHQSQAGTEDAPALSEYVAACEAKRNIEYITAIGEFMRKHRGKTTFTEQDLETGFEDAAKGVPQNLSRDITWAKKASWIAPKTGADGQYYVTVTGREAIADKFSLATRAKSKASAGGRKKKKKVTPKGP
ncbi:MAG: hypothetical protein ACKVU4_07195 [Phycisphaerales bacterium]